MGLLDKIKERERRMRPIPLPITEKGTNDPVRPEEIQEERTDDTAVPVSNSNPSSEEIQVNVVETVQIGDVSIRSEQVGEETPAAAEPVVMPQEEHAEEIVHEIVDIPSEDTSLPEADNQDPASEEISDFDIERDMEETYESSSQFIPNSWEKVGVIYGNVGTNSFDCRVCSRLEKSEYVMVKHEDYGYILCQVGSLVRRTNVTLEKSMSPMGTDEIEDIITAHIDVIGYRNENGLLLTPRTTFKALSDVLRADQELIKKILGLRMKPSTHAYIGVLHGHDIPVSLNINQLLQRHVCILAKTGGGKSYISGDIIEELMKHNVTCMIIDPHGEYSAMKDPGSTTEDKFHVVARGFGDKIKEFRPSAENPEDGVRPLRFTFRTLEARDILELTKAHDLRTFLPPLNKALESLRSRAEFYSVRDLIDLLSSEKEYRNAVLINELQYIDSMGVFAARGSPISELVEKGMTTVINLKGVPPDIQCMIVKRLSTVLFEFRKKGNIPPMMLVVEEAHNYCPQNGTVMSSDSLATIASEGRKFGLGLTVISQRPAKIDKNVLSQCGTQIILKVTNPNDLKAISQSIEGLTNGMIDEIQSMPVGMAMVVGAGIDSPLLIEVRPRQSRHGGAGVNVLEEDE